MSERPLRILYFAWLRERIGTDEESVPMPAGVRDVGGLSAWLRGRGGRYESAFAAGPVIRCAVNQVFAGPDTAVAPGDEVAFFPPVTGG